VPEKSWRHYGSDILSLSALFDTGLSVLNVSRSAAPSTGKAAPSLKPRGFLERDDNLMLLQLKLFEAQSPDLFFLSLSTQPEEAKLIQVRMLKNPTRASFFRLYSFTF